MKEIMEKELQFLRENIDRTDEKIIRLIGERFKYTKQIGLCKAKYGLPIRNAKREEELFARMGKLSKEEGLDDKMIKKIWKMIVRNVCMIHKSLRA
ncbi:MAG: chorismate mutase [Patescibacteria group bacterium]